MLESALEQIGQSSRCLPTARGSVKKVHFLSQFVFCGVPATTQKYESFLDHCHSKLGNGDLVKCLELSYLYLFVLEIFAVNLGNYNACRHGPVEDVERVLNHDCHFLQEVEFSVGLHSSPLHPAIFFLDYYDAVLQS